MAVFSAQTARRILEPRRLVQVKLPVGVLAQIDALVGDFEDPIRGFKKTDPSRLGARDGAEGPSR
jgi:hypothetical protein